MNILVTGATGQLGKAVIDGLLKETNVSNIKALVRDEAKADELKAKGIAIAVGDYDNAEALKKAFKGVDKLYLVSGNDIENRAKQQANVIVIAKEVGVKHIIYTSVQFKKGIDKSPIDFIEASHFKTEELIKASGMTYTILGNTLYTDVIPMFAGEHVLNDKTIRFPAEEGKTAFALRSDIAEASAKILVDETGKYDNKTLEITGAEALSWKEIAAIIGETTGLAIIYDSTDPAAYETMLKEAEVPETFIAMLSGFGQAVALDVFANVSSDLENVLGRKPTSVKTYLQSIYQK